MQCNEANQGYCANADQDGNCYNVGCEAYRQDTVRHTEGPWEAVGASVHATSGKEIIHWRYNTRNGTEQEQEANARLIAAAPTMAAYLERKAAEGDTEAKTILNTID